MLTQGVFVRETPLRKEDFVKGQGSIMSRRLIKKLIIVLMLACSGVALYALYNSNQNTGINTNWKALVNNMQIDEPEVKFPIEHVTFEKAPPRRTKPKKLIVDDYERIKAFRPIQRPHEEKAIDDPPNYDEDEEEKNYVKQEEYNNYKNNLQYDFNNDNSDVLVEDKQQDDDIQEEMPHRNGENSVRRQKLKQQEAQLANVPEEYVVRNHEGRVVEEKLFDGGINHHIVKKLRKGVQKRPEANEKAELWPINENIEEEKRPENEDLLANQNQPNEKVIDLNVDLNSGSISDNKEVERVNVGRQRQHEYIGENQDRDEMAGRVEPNNEDAGRVEPNNEDAFGLQNKNDGNGNSFQNNDFGAERRVMLRPFGLAVTEPNIGVQLNSRRENGLDADRDVDVVQDLQDKLQRKIVGQEKKEKYIPYIVRNGIVERNRTFDVDNINAGQDKDGNYLADNPPEKKKYISYLERNGMVNVDQNKIAGVTTKWRNLQDNLLNQESGIEQHVQENVNPGRKDDKMKEILSKLPPDVLANLIKNQQVKLGQLKQSQQIDQIEERQLDAKPQQIQQQPDFDQRGQQVEQQQRVEQLQQVEQQQRAAQQFAKPQQLAEQQQLVEQKQREKKQHLAEQQQQVEQQQFEEKQQQAEQQQLAEQQKLAEQQQQAEQNQQAEQQHQNLGAQEPNEQAGDQREKIQVEDLFAPLRVPATCVPFKFLTGSAQVCIHTGNRDSVVSARIQLDGFYEKEIMDQFYEILMQDSELGVVDVGANIGVYSLAAALLNRHVVAVEPLYRNYRLLHKSAQENQVTSKITLVTEGLDNESYVGQMYYSNDGGYSNVTIVKLTRDMKQDRANIVQVTTLDNLLQVIPFSRALLKLDASGGMEERILKAGGTFFKTLTVPYILTHWSVSTNRDNCFAMASELNRLGYHPKLAWNGAEVNSEFLQNDSSFLVWHKRT